VRNGRQEKLFGASLLPTPSVPVSCPPLLSRIQGQVLADPRLFQKEHASAIQSALSAAKVWRSSTCLELVHRHFFPQIVPSELTIVSNLHASSAVLGHWVPVPMSVKQAAQAGDKLPDHWTVTAGSACIASSPTHAPIEVRRCCVGCFGAHHSQKLCVLMWGFGRSCAVPSMCPLRW
jgi:hypothetical protein